MPRAKASDKTKTAAKTAPAPEKPVKKTKAALLAKATEPRKAKAKTAARVKTREEKVELRQPVETVVGRFYEITQKDDSRIVGELVEDAKGIQTIEPWVEGRPVGADYRIETNFKTRNVREISRETAFELSHSHIH